MIPRIKRFLFPAIAILTVSAFPAVFLYCQNADEAGFSEILLVLLVYSGTGTILLLLISALTRSVEKSAVVVSLFMLMLTNFSFIENAMKLVLPKLKYWHTVPIVLVVGLHIAYLVFRFLNQEFAADITKALGFVFGSLLIFNTIMSMPQIIHYAEAQHQLKKVKDAQEQQESTTTGMPNVYLLIFDEYANFPQLEQYYHYDNSPLRSFLEEHNFSISFTSHNESISSSTVQTNLVNLDYVVDDLTNPSDKTVLRKNGTLFNLMRENGYYVQIFEKPDFYGGRLPSIDKTFSESGAMTINGETLSDVLLRQSILYPAWQSIKENDSDALRHRVTITADYLSDPVNLPDGGVFTLAYFCFPHQPFFVDENGRPNPIEHWEDWEDDKYYLGQLKYATKQMLQILENIVSNDPNAIIILQSDHGARAGIGTTSAKQKFSWESMNNPLNTIYYQGKNFEIEGLSSVNTLRAVCNQLFGLDYEMLTIPEK